MEETKINVIIKLKNKNDELKYKRANFYITKDFDKNTEKLFVELISEKQYGTILLIANMENVEYIYLYEEKSEDDK